MADAEFNHRTLTYKRAEQLHYVCTSIHVHSASEEPIFLPATTWVGLKGPPTLEPPFPPLPLVVENQNREMGGEEILVSPAMKLISRASVAVFVSFKNSSASGRDFLYFFLIVSNLQYVNILSVGILCIFIHLHIYYIAN